MEEEYTRRKQTFILSWEFVIAVAVNLVAVTWLIRGANAAQDERIVALESTHASAERVARIEERVERIPIIEQKLDLLIEKQKKVIEEIVRE